MRSLSHTRALWIELKIHSCLGETRCLPRCIINSADKPCHLAHLHSIIAHFNLPVSTLSRRGEEQTRVHAPLPPRQRPFFISLFIPRHCTNFKVGAAAARKRAFFFFSAPCLSNYFLAAWIFQGSVGSCHETNCWHFFMVLGKCQMFAFCVAKIDDVRIWQFHELRSEHFCPLQIFGRNSFCGFDSICVCLVIGCGETKFVGSRYIRYFPKFVSLLMTHRIIFFSPDSCKKFQVNGYFFCS